jgi:hypothetical protein
VISIDPGVSGGIAWSLGTINSCQRMPKTEGELLDLLISLRMQHRDACMEKISGFIPDGGAGQMFTFGESYGLLRGICLGLRYRIQLVSPKDWQRALGVGKPERVKAPPGSPEDVRKAAKAANARHKSEWKRKLCDEARRRNPELGSKVTMMTCDALLILDYAKQIMR